MQKFRAYQHFFYIKPILNKKGIDIDLVNDEKYETRLDKIKYNDDKMEQIKELFAYSRGLNSVMNDINADFSVSVLSKLGFAWADIDEDYIERFLNATKTALFES